MTDDELTAAADSAVAALTGVEPGERVSDEEAAALAVFLFDTFMAAEGHPPDEEHERLRASLRRRVITRPWPAPRRLIFGRRLSCRTVRPRSRARRSRRSTRAGPSDCDGSDGPGGAGSDLTGGAP